MQQRYTRLRHVQVATTCLGLAALGLVLVLGSDHSSSVAVVTGMLGVFFVVVAVVTYGGLLVRVRTPAGALTVFLAGWAVVVLGLDSRRFGVVVLTALALFFATLPVFAITGRWVAGGLWLTPTRLVHRAYGVSAWTHWDDVLDADPATVPEPASRADPAGRPGRG